MRSFTKVLILFLLINLLFNVFCEETTCVVILHGRGESITGGMAHHFAVNLRTILSNKNMTNFDVIEVGLSSDSEEDYNWSSFKSMDFQLEKLCQYINQTVLDRFEQNCTRIQLVGCSQGALLMRGLLKGQCLDSVVPKIDKLILFGGPNNGIFGVPSCNLLSHEVSFLKFGCLLLQRTVNMTGVGPSVYDDFIYSANQLLSFSSYWNSPKNVLKETTFLADINNENTTNSTKYLSEKVKTLVVISFENERVVLPTISTAFGYWDEKAIHFISFNRTELYVKDLFGLKTLDENNSIHFETIANCTHMKIPLNFIRHQFLSYIT